MRYRSTLRTKLTHQLKRTFPRMPEEDILISALQELIHATALVNPIRHPYPEVPLVLIEIRSPAGIITRCDANCYDGHRLRCDCPCAGLNHGRGLGEAIRNMAGIIVERIPALWIAKNQDHLPADCYWLAQLPLWVDARNLLVIAETARELMDSARGPKLGQPLK